MILEVGVLKVSGEQAKSFLHALVASDLESLKNKYSQSSLLLDPSGKLICAFWIYCIDENNYLLICSSTTVKSLFDGLKKFLIRTKAEIIDVSNEYLAVVDINSNIAEDLVISNQYLGIDGLTLGLRPFDENVKNYDSKLHEMLRISNGIVSSQDLQDGVIPQEANLDIESVSFSKGCFLGQELVCRIDSRQASTPFSFYAIHSNQKMPRVSGGLELFIDGTIVSKATSFIDDETPIGTDFEKFNGSVKAIVKLPRKFVQILENDDFNGQLELVDAENPGTRTIVTDFHKVSGGFSI